jgi:hypothetical protein
VADTTSPRPRQATGSADPVAAPPTREPIPKTHIDVLLAAGLYFMPPSEPMDLAALGRELRAAADIGIKDAADTVPYTATLHPDLEPAAMAFPVKSAC